jgi:hypothetical protein
VGPVNRHVRILTRARQRGRGRSRAALSLVVS